MTSLMEAQDRPAESTRRATGLRPRLLFLMLLVPVLLVTVGCGPQSSPAPASTPAPPTQVPASITQAPVAVATSTSVASIEVGNATAAAEEPVGATEAVPALDTPEPTASPSPTAVVGPHQFVNPVVKSDFPDPGVLLVNGTYYAFATNSAPKNIQVARSTDLVSWTMLGDGLPVIPKWASASFGYVWAPEVIKIGDRYVMYFAARMKGTSNECIGVATSATPEGPYKDTSDKPFVCQLGEGGSIDPSPYREGDKLYLYWKNDGNCCGSTTYIYVQQLSPDGMSLLGEPTQLLSNDTRWEGPVVEAPTMWKENDKHFLFFSANAYNSPYYAVGYAACESATGPCTAAPENPILKTSTQRPPAIGPGHQTVVLDEHGDTWLVYHVWAVPVAGELDKRFMWLDRLTWEDGKPHVHGPTTAPQEKP